VTLKPFVLKEEALERLSQLLGARRLLASSRAAFRQQAAALPYARRALQPAIRALAQQIRGLDQDLARRARQQPAIAQLQAVPGIGPISAATLAVRLKSSIFASYDQFVAYVGLDLRVSESGAHRGRRRVSHHGDAELRRLLYLCAQASVRTKGSPFAVQYQRELAKGLAPTQALCAIARKMAKVTWALVRTGAPYDPDRVYQPPTHA
jgi:transposase